MMVVVVVLLLQRHGFLPIEFVDRCCTFENGFLVGFTLFFLFFGVDDTGANQSCSLFKNADLHLLRRGGLGRVTL
jgi:hypothetical protein